ncbi:MAG: branched-chain amino acid ABC transporter permease [Chloroflexi bacterium]|nr:MAG: branched-chain amino acid ABC transporter permease [Chloroflexota bacterium]
MLRQALVTGVLVGSVFGLVAMGLTLIFGVLHIINFAHGALLTVGMYITFTLFESFNVDPYLSVFVTIPALFILGIIIQRLIIHPARNAPGHNQLLLTLGLALFIENALLVGFTATPRFIRLSYARDEFSLGPITLDFPLRVFGTTVTLEKLAAFIFALLLTGVLYFILQRTDLGKAIRATAQDKEGAALVGIDIDRISMITFGIGTACVGAAAALVLPFLQVDPVAGNAFNITAFVIVVLGGMGNVLGALIGGLIIGLTQELWVVLPVVLPFPFPSSTKLLSVFIVFVLVLFFRPQGILGKK